MSKTNPECANFIALMDKLARVPHGEPKAKLDAEKAEKAEEARFRRQAKKLRESPASKDVHYTVEAKDNPRLQVMNEILAKQRRRRVN
ncbi:MAG: hypothetical protein ABSG10_01055 [Terracidiphilus sp.]